MTSKTKNSLHFFESIILYNKNIIFVLYFVLVERGSFTDSETEMMKEYISRLQKGIYISKFFFKFLFFFYNMKSPICDYL